MKNNSNLLFEAYLLIALCIVFFLPSFLKYLWTLFPEKEPEKKLKSTLADDYSMKSDTLMKQISIFCPDSYVEKYIYKPVKKIPVDIVYEHLGHPEPGRDFSKSALADACFTHRNTLNQRLKRVPNFKTKTGITFEQYSSLRLLTPKLFHRLLALHREHFSAEVNE